MDLNVLLLRIIRETVGVSLVIQGVEVLLLLILVGRNDLGVNLLILTNWLPVTIIGLLALVQIRALRGLIGKILGFHIIIRRGIGLDLPLVFLVELLNYLL